MYAHQLDVKNAFLLGELIDVIYMKVPEGIENCKNKVCKLNKSLYGLQQAPAVWNKNFDEFVKGIGFRQSDADRCLYVCNKNLKVSYLLLYVDDFIIASNSREELVKIKEILMSKFRMRDIGELSYFLGISITRKNGNLYLDQSVYIDKVLKKFNMENCKPINTPIEISPSENLESESIIGVKPYRELLGSLLYAALITRPDICTAVNFYGRFQNNATEVQWKGLKRILRYMKGTVNVGLQYQSNTDCELASFVDADWASHVDRKSVSGCVIKVYGNTVDWYTKKQSTIALSSTEAEFNALSEGLRELRWVNKLLKEMGVKVGTPIIMHEDNQSCIHMITGEWGQKRLRHMDIRYKFIKYWVEQGFIVVNYINSENQEADLFTKPLPLISFSKLKNKIGIIEIN
jgi:ribonuclease HI